MKTALVVRSAIFEIKVHRNGSQYLQIMGFRPCAAHPIKSKFEYPVFGSPPPPFISASTVGNKNMNKLVSQSERKYFSKVLKSNKNYNVFDLFKNKIQQFEKKLRAVTIVIFLWRARQQILSGITCKLQYLLITNKEMAREKGRGKE